MEIMNKDHCLWEEFCDEMDYSIVNHRGENMCDHTTAITRKVLETYYDVDVEATLEAFALEGGFCDCEIVYNVIFED